MIGQGRPYRSFVALHRKARISLLASLTALLCLVPRAVGAAEIETENGSSLMRLRITLGGGEPRMWSGQVSLSEGQFREPTLLGLEPDEPGSMRVGARVIQIRQPTPRSYDGLDIDVFATLDATIKVRLSAYDTPSDVRDFDIKLSDLINGVHPRGDDGANQLDDQGNRLVVSRAPGDRLRVRFARDNLVFAPDEAFTFTVGPHLLGLPAGEDVLLKLRIVSRLNGKEHFIRERAARVGEDGSLEAWGPHEFPVPDSDDVYELVVSISKPRLLDPLVPTNPLTTSRPLLERRLQFVGIKDTVDEPAIRGIKQPQERLVDELDPVSATWGERVTRWPLLKRIGRIKQEKLSHGRHDVARHLDRQWMQMAPDAWQAHPLSIDAIGEPHILEIEYPDDIPQTLGISLLQPNAIGKIAPLGVDTAVEVEVPEIGTAAAIGRHRLVFWPKSKTPILLLTSGDSERSTIYGKIRVYRIEDKLAARYNGKPRGQERLIGAWLDKPLLPEMFGASDAADRLTARSLDDWQTFYEAGTRFTQQLQYAGYNTAVVPALCEGSAIYPSHLLQPTPKYDTGIYLTDGHDPQRKDALEMLFRLFDREGLTLLPSLQFDTPLPELEVLRGGDAQARHGLELLNREGRSWVDRQGTRGGLAPYYNPLDPRVQGAMTDVLRELVERYGHHPSFGGVVLQLSPHGYAMLPGDDWAYDDRTFTRFITDNQLADPGLGRDRFAERARWCSTTGRTQWLSWRAEQMTTLYRNMANEVQNVKHKSKNDMRRLQLILAGPDMLSGETLRRVLRPTLATKPATDQQVREALLESGIDPTLLAAEAGLTLVAPHPEIAYGAPQNNPQWDDTAIDVLHTQLAAAGSLMFRAPVTQRVESFDIASPFGSENTYTWLAAQVSPAGDANRRRFAQCLARADQTIIFDGGWMLPRGQEDTLAETLAVLRQLPTKRLTTTPSSPLTQPVILRTGKNGDETFAVLINNSPWPVTAQVSVLAEKLWSVRPLIQGAPAGERDGKSTWNVTLPPHGTVSGVFNHSNVELRVTQVSLPKELRGDLVGKLRDIRNRSVALKRPSPRNGDNFNFEEPPDATGKVFGWVHAEGDGIDVTLTDGGHNGSPRALRVVSRGPEVWVRSQPLPTPKTGRIAVWARLRTPSNQPQPQLRLAIEARRDGRSYYRFANVGAGVPAAALADDWAPFILQIDDLPRDELEEFRIGFDLMGAGEVWIDDVVIYDASFSEKEQFQISRLIAAADFHLREENIAAAAQVIDGYWPQFLLEHIEPPQAEIADTPVREAPVRPVEERPLRQSFMNRAKGLWPF